MEPVHPKWADIKKGMLLSKACGLIQERSMAIGQGDMRAIGAFLDGQAKATGRFFASGREGRQAFIRLDARPERLRVR